MGKDKPNIAPHTKKIFEMFGLNPPDVRSVTITPRKIEFEVFLRNEDGHKYLIAAEENLPGSDPGDLTTFSQIPATETLTFEVRT